MVGEAVISPFCIIGEYIVTLAARLSIAGIASASLFAAFAMEDLMGMNPAVAATVVLDVLVLVYVEVSVVLAVSVSSTITVLVRVVM